MLLFQSDHRKAVIATGMRRAVSGLLVVALNLLLLASASGQAYQKPPKAVLDVLDSPVTPTAFISPTRDHMLLAQGVRYPPIADLAEPMLRLAGLRINPRTNAIHRVPYFVALTVKRISDGTEVHVQLPSNAQVGFPQWSADGKYFAFTNTTPSGVQLWIAETQTAKARQVKGVRVSAITGTPIQWMPDQRNLLVQLVPDKRGEIPLAAAVPTAPLIQESSGKAGPVRTFQDLLANPHDEALFDYYATSQMALVTIAGTITPISTPAVFETVDPSPDGKFILAARVTRPYSYLLPLFAFPRELEIWDSTGKVVHKIASLPLADQVPIDGVRTGPRTYAWHPVEPATVVWVEALDGGDPKKKVPFRDKLVTLRAPFKEPAAELIKIEQRYNGRFFTEDGLLTYADYDRDKRWRRTFLINPRDSKAEPRLVWSLNVSDRYNNPGTPVSKMLPNGSRAIQRAGDWIYLTGVGASTEGDRPFLDRLNVKTLKTERLFHSDAESYETVVALLKDDATQFITRRETPIEPSNYFVRELSATAAAHASKAVRPLTSFPDHTPELRKIKKRLVTYKREDGVQLSFTLYLPPDYKEGTRLPTVVWAYPLEFTDQDVAGQVTGSIQRFTTIGGPSHLFFLLSGYAVLDNATMPVVGDPETVNNTFIEQIVLSAKAAIDKAVEMGVTDPERVGVGGHSYGAFMTANLLAHSDLFRAGIARSGAYNRTLTPFGFQSERRTLWEATELYVRVSPFMYAHKINEPILLIHGEADNNAGTFPIQSERLYQAVRGNGGTVRLVMLPLESHGYAARESTEHALFEMISWFDRYVKNAKPRQPAIQAEVNPESLKDN